MNGDKRENRILRAMFKKNPPLLLVGYEGFTTFKWNLVWPLEGSIMPYGEQPD